MATETCFWPPASKSCWLHAVRPALNVGWPPRSRAGRCPSAGRTSNPRKPPRRERDLARCSVAGPTCCFMSMPEARRININADVGGLTKRSAIMITSMAANQTAKSERRHIVRHAVSVPAWRLRHCCLSDVGENRSSQSCNRADRSHPIERHIQVLVWWLSAAWRPARLQRRPFFPDCPDPGWRYRCLGTQILRLSCRGRLSPLDRACFRYTSPLC